MPDGVECDDLLRRFGCDGLGLDLFSCYGELTRLLEICGLFSWRFFLLDEGGEVVTRLQPSFDVGDGLSLA